jgi:hypothetical protein
MEIRLLSNFVSLALAASFAVSAAARLFPVLRRILSARGLGQPRWSVVMGSLSRILAALFLILPQTRIWGGTLAASITFIMVVQQLAKERYSHALPGVLMMIAIPFALASGPLS